jgi:hypothetical protein
MLSPAPEADSTIKSSRLIHPSLATVLSRLSSPRLRVVLVRAAGSSFCLSALSNMASLLFSERREFIDKP